MGENYNELKSVDFRMTVKLQFVFDEKTTERFNPPKIIGMIETIGNLATMGGDNIPATCTLEEALKFLKETDKLAGWNSNNATTVKNIQAVCKAVSMELYGKLINNPESCLETKLHWKFCYFARRAMKSYKFNVVAALHAKWGCRQEDKQLIYYFEGILLAESSTYGKHLFMTKVAKLEERIMEDNLVGKCYIQLKKDNDKIESVIL